MSITDLENIEVSSVTKTSESLSNAPASIYVISHDRIVRSGAATLPEVLRLAPNLQVNQISASHYVITARGFSGNTADQNFSNKLLVLIDGRSVYTPLYSGVYWDMQDVLIQDIERIEVISGPGATLWGANAVNGVINIITRKASQTQGGLLSIAAGNLEHSAALRYGGRISDELTYRAYVMDYLGGNTETATGARAIDHWSKAQGGFRTDWTPSAADTFTFQGDAYGGSDAQAGYPNEDIDGRNLLARWSHAGGDGSSLQVQAYYDHTGRGTPGNGNYGLDTYDLDIQHSFNPAPSHQITWGGSVRLSQYRINGTPTFLFSPASRNLNLSDIFVQDSITMTDTVDAIFGLKIEGDPYSGVAALPSVRLSWKASEDTLLWAAVSRAIRSPTPFDTDVVEKIGSIVYLTGNTDFQSETLTAFELGLRMQPTEQMSFSVSAFYNDYDNLRSIEFNQGASFLPFHWDNLLKGYTYGLEAWSDYQLLPWWRLTASFIELNEHFNFKPGSSQLLGVAQIGDDPEQRASLKSSINLGPDVSLDADIRYVGTLPNPHVPDYVELNTRIGWNVSDTVQLSLSGFNLLHARHLEFPASEANAVPRSFSVNLQWRF